MKDIFLQKVLIPVNITAVAIITYILLFGVNCKQNNIDPEEAVSTYIGKWILAWTNVNMDSVYVKKVILKLNSDSTFSCDASFFMRRDTKMALPCSGRWKIILTNPNSYTDASKPNKLQLTSDSLSRDWSITGLASAGYMDWASGVITYSWILTK